MKHPQVFAIEWHDAVSNSGWEDIGSVDPPHECVSIGFITFENEDYVTVAATYAGGQSNNRISIPKGWIKSRRELKL